MCVGCHQAHPLERLRIQRHVGCESVALAGILQHVGIRHTNHLAVCSGIGQLIVLIDGTTVSTVQTGIATHVAQAPVGNAHSVDGLVEDTLNSNRERERYGNLIVYSQGGLPYLRHLEVGGNTVHRT